MTAQTAKAGVGGGTEKMLQQNIRNDSYTDQLKEKWEGYIDHIGDEEKAKVTAMMLENENANLESIVQKSSSGGMITESSTTTTQAVDGYAQTIFPVLMRVFPNLIAHELVSIQPMSGPVGAIFYFEYKYGTNKGEINKGQNLIETFDEDYSSQEVDKEVVQRGNGTDFGGSGSTMDVTVNFSPVIPKRDDLADPDYKVVVEEVDAAGTVIQHAEDDGDGNFTQEASQGSIDYTTGAITNFLFNNPPADGNDIVVRYFYVQEGNEDIPTVSMDVERETIEAKERTLNMNWTFESADDLRALHGIDGESHLLSGVSNQLGLEIDREIIREIDENVAFTDVFDRAGGAPGLDEVSHLREIVTKITDVSSQIHDATKRARANWIVTSPAVTSIFMQLETHGDFIPASPQEERPSSYGAMTSDFGVYKVGALMNRFDVYQDPYINKDKVLIGLRGQNYLDAGFVYAPYIALEMTPTFQDPDDGKYKKRLRTRYAKRLLRENYYGRVNVLNI